jgi:hypothetical protein
MSSFPHRAKEREGANACGVWSGALTTVNSGISPARALRQ